MLTVAPGVILPATPVAASIMMAISCSPARSSGLRTIMSDWRSEPPRSSVTAIFPSTSRRSVTAFSDSQRLGIAIFSNWPLFSAVYGATSDFSW
ncbi:hypothetical protein SCYAM73S_01276 [Streptomyces cyaneofuscatus]